MHRADFAIEPRNDHRLAQQRDTEWFVLQLARIGDGVPVFAHRGEKLRHFALFDVNFDIRKIRHIDCSLIK
ncbi:hypothetical protein [Paraburkholderia phytofirmans]|uniref:Uncharacterized protein n=1 Tax=Paraburkholderia phytofirmans TaxID=261302 RepID=A0ABW9B8R1_9BURK|nr:hypothetical protein [Paraburkholderia phytofirmans]